MSAEYPGVLPTYGRPTGRNGVEAVRQAADPASAPALAIAEIRTLIDRPHADGPRLIVNATTIRNILTKHGL